MTWHTWFVPGHPAPQGSKRHVGGGRMIESSTALGPWRQRIALFTHNALLDVDLIDGPVHIQCHFVMRRPVNTPSTTPPAIKRPDLDKLCRAVLDGITGTAIYDDSQITELSASKRIAEPGETPGVHIHLKGTEHV